jgi:hypothetical protein
LGGNRGDALKSRLPCFKALKQGSLLKEKTSYFPTFCLLEGEFDSSLEDSGGVGLG